MLQVFYIIRSFRYSHTVVEAHTLGMRIQTYQFHCVFHMISLFSFYSVSLHRSISPFVSCSHQQIIFCIVIQFPVVSFAVDPYSHNCVGVNRLDHRKH